MKPFEGWGTNNNLGWWNAYTDLKHSKLKIGDQQR